MSWKYSRSTKCARREARGHITAELLMLCALMAPLFVVGFSIWHVRRVHHQIWSDTNRDIAMALVSPETPIGGPLAVLPYDLDRVPPRGMALSSLPHNAAHAERRATTASSDALLGTLREVPMAAEAAGIRTPWAWSSAPYASGQSEADVAAVRLWYARGLDESIGDVWQMLRLAGRDSDIAGVARP